MKGIIAMSGSTRWWDDEASHGSYDWGCHWAGCGDWVQVVRTMTDKQKLVALFTEFGIGFKEEGTQIVLNEGDAHITGYSYFYTAFEFDEDGRFIEVGAWE